MNKHLNIINNLIKQIFVYSLIFVFLFNTNVISASIVIDKKYGNAYKKNANNGVPVININTPNTNGGLSYNIYEILNVGPEGVIFNNSTTTVNTQLGGAIAENNNLTTGVAGLILNEVSGKTTSNLLGYMEIAGSKADLIIANQNGIVCNGCGFLNVNKGVLTTGKAAIENNLLKGFTVKQGAVEIGSLGLDARQTPGLDIIAKRLDLKGDIKGRDISIFLGNQQYNYQNKTSNSLELQAKEVWAISSSEVGGIYGDYIKLISVNEGVGVNIDFTMGSRTGNIEIDANGNLKIINGFIMGNDEITINAQNIEIIGSTISGNSTTLNAKNNIEIKTIKIGFLFPTTIYGALTTNSRSFKIHQGSVFRATVHSAKNNIFTLNTKTFHNQGSLINGGGVKFNVDNFYNEEGGTISSDGNLTFRGYANKDGHANNKMQSLLNNSASIEAKGSIDIKTHKLENKVSWVKDEQVFGEYYDMKGEESGAGYMYAADTSFASMVISGSTDAREQYYFKRYRGLKAVNYAHWLQYFDVSIKARDINYVIHSQAAAANLRSGGTLNIEADTVDNYGSKITAWSDIKITADTTTNRSVSGQSFTELTKAKEFWDNLGRHDTVVGNDDYRVLSGKEYYTTKRDVEDVVVQSAEITGGGTVSIDYNNKGNGEVTE